MLNWYAGCELSRIQVAFASLPAKVVATWGWPAGSCFINLVCLCCIYRPFWIHWRAKQRPAVRLLANLEWASIRSLWWLIKWKFSPSQQSQIALVIAGIQTGKDVAETGLRGCSWMVKRLHEVLLENWGALDSTCLPELKSQNEDRFRRTE